jgi:predicted membrane protein
MSSGPAPKDQRPGEVPLKTYVGALAAFATALAVSWAYWYSVELDARILAGTAVFAGLVLASFALSLRIGDHTVMGTWDVWLVLAVVALGPTWAALAAVPTALFVGRRDWLRAVYDVGQNVITIHLAGAVFSLSSGPLLLAESADAAVCYGALAAGATLVVANEVIDGGLLRVKYGQPFRETWEENWRPYLPSDAVNVLTVGLGVLAFVVYGPLAAAVAVVGSMVSRALVHRSRD